MDELIYYIIAAYFLGISLIAALVTVVDKLKARFGAWRIRERTLFVIAALGGSVAMYITMRWIRHKTQHRSFMIGIPLIIAAQALVIIILDKILL